MYTILMRKRKKGAPLNSYTHWFCLAPEDVELVPGLAEETDGAGGIHLGGREFPWTLTVVGADVKVGGIGTDCKLAVVGVKVQQFVVCMERNQLARG